MKGDFIMNEVERIALIRARISVQKRQELLEQLKVVEDAFKEMIKGVEETLIKDEAAREAADETLLTAIKRIAALSKEAGVAFPEVVSVPDAKMYTLQYGITIMNS